MIQIYGGALVPTKRHCVDNEYNHHSQTASHFIRIRKGRGAYVMLFLHTFVKSTSRASLYASTSHAKNAQICDLHVFMQLAWK